MSRWFSFQKDPPDREESSAPVADAPSTDAAALTVPMEAQPSISLDAENGRPIGFADDLNTSGEAEVVHAVLKNTDVWFAYHVSALEREALDLARKHAEMGLPRHDLARETPTEMEQIIERQARETMSGWMERVKRKMEGAIGAETERAGSALMNVRHAIQGALNAKSLREDATRATPSRQHPVIQIVPEAQPAGESGAPKHEVHCHRHMSGYVFWPMIVLLIFADFFANAPLFSELFPSNRALSQYLRDWQDAQGGNVDSILGLGGFGFRNLMGHILIHPEPAILAFSVVVFFMFLGHALGGHARIWFALRRVKQADPSAPTAQASHQALLPMIGATVGILLTVFVLFVARSHVQPMAETRYAKAMEAAGSARQDYEAARAGSANGPEVSRARTATVAAADEVVFRRERLDYAESLSAMNWPIAGLNLVLVISAIIAGYLREHRSFKLEGDSADALALQNETERRRREEEDQRRTEHRQRIERLERDYRDAIQQAHTSLNDAETALHRATLLLDANALRDWYGKAERLRKANSLFRSENARLRGLDVRDIAAFRVPVEMHLPEPSTFAAPQAPAAYSEHLRTFAELHEAVARFEVSDEAEYATATA